MKTCIMTPQARKRLALAKRANDQEKRLVRLMKEHPIIFSGEMVRAILYGWKTQTRRVVKLEGVEDCEWYENRDGDRMKIVDYCPYGIHGDRLWVREAWFDDAMFGSPKIHFRADGEFDDQFVLHKIKRVGPFKWQPSIFMPRWASRITLEIVSVRVERVQEIKNADIEAEGVLNDKWYEYDEWCRTVATDDIPVTRLWERDWFANLWNSINAKRGYGWDKNPWVWVIEFRRVRRNANMETETWPL